MVDEYPHRGPLQTRSAQFLRVHSYPVGGGVGTGVGLGVGTGVGGGVGLLFISMCAVFHILYGGKDIKIYHASVQV